MSSSPSSSSRLRRWMCCGPSGSQHEDVRCSRTAPLSGSAGSNRDDDEGLGSFMQEAPPGKRALTMPSFCCEASLSIPQPPSITTAPDVTLPATAASSRSAWLGVLASKAGPEGVPVITPQILADHLEKGACPAEGGDGGYRGQPVAVLTWGCKAQPAQQEDCSSTPASAATWVQSLDVAYLSSCARILLNTYDQQGYKLLLRSLLAAAPHMQEIVESLLEKARAAASKAPTMRRRSTAAAALSTRPVSASPSLSCVAVPVPGCNLRLMISAVLLKATLHAAAAEAAVVIEHVVPEQAQLLTKQLYLYSALMGQTDHMLSVCTLEGGVIFQNAAAVRYAGHRMRPPISGLPTVMDDASDSSADVGCSSCSSGQPHFNYLKALLHLEPELLDDLLEEVAVNGEWSAVVQVPQTLQPGAAGPAPSQCVDLQGKAAPTQHAVHTYTAQNSSALPLPLPLPPPQLQQCEADSQGPASGQQAQGDERHSVLHAVPQHAGASGDRASANAVSSCLHADNDAGGPPPDSSLAASQRLSSSAWCAPAGPPEVSLRSSSATGPVDYAAPATLGATAAGAAAGHVVSPHARGLAAAADATERSSSCSGRLPLSGWMLASPAAGYMLLGQDTSPGQSTGTLSPRTTVHGNPMFSNTSAPQLDGLARGPASGTQLPPTPSTPLHPVMESLVAEPGAPVFDELASFETRVSASPGWQAMRDPQRSPPARQRSTGCESPVITPRCSSANNVASLGTLADSSVSASATPPRRRQVMRQQSRLHALLAGPSSATPAGSQPSSSYALGPSARPQPLPGRSVASSSSFGGSDSRWGSNNGTVNLPASRTSCLAPATSLEGPNGVTPSLSPTASGVSRLSLLQPRSTQAPARPGSQHGTARKSLDQPLAPWRTLDEPSRLSPVGVASSAAADSSEVPYEQPPPSSTACQLSLSDSSPAAPGSSQPTMESGQHSASEPLSSRVEPGPVESGASSSSRAWHEIRVCPQVDPYTGRRVLLVAQEDVSGRLESEARMAEVSDACISLISLIFPRHVIEHLALKAPPAGVGDGAPGSNGAGAGGSGGPEALRLPVDGSNGHMLDQLASKHPCVTLFFCDIVGFTTMSKEVEPAQVMRFLNDLYTRYDQLVDKWGVYKVETVGDCYVVAGGLMAQDDQGFAVVNTEGAGAVQHALAVYRFAQEVLQVASHTRMPHSGEPVKVRVGLHSGPVTSGVVGYRMPKFCLFGDSMNTASRMETTGMPGCIQLSEATYQLLQLAGASQDLACTGGVEVKGKGRMITYLYTPPPEEAPGPVDSVVTRIAGPMVPAPDCANGGPHMEPGMEQLALLVAEANSADAGAPVERLPSWRTDLGAKIRHSNAPSAAQQPEGSPGMQMRTMKQQASGGEGSTTRSPRSSISLQGKGALEILLSLAEGGQAGTALAGNLGSCGSSFGSTEASPLRAPGGRTRRTSMLQPQRSTERLSPQTLQARRLHASSSCGSPVATEEATPTSHRNGAAPHDELGPMVDGCHATPKRRASRSATVTWDASLHAAMHGSSNRSSAEVLVARKSKPADALTSPAASQHTTGSSQTLADPGQGLRSARSSHAPPSPPASAGQQGLVDARRPNSSGTVSCNAPLHHLMRTQQLQQRPIIQHTRSIDEQLCAAMSPGAAQQAQHSRQGTAPHSPHSDASQLSSPTHSHHGPSSSQAPVSLLMQTVAWPSSPSDLPCRASEDSPRIKASTPGGLLSILSTMHRANSAAVSGHSRSFGRRAGGGGHAAAPHEPQRLMSGLRASSEAQVDDGLLPIWRQASFSRPGSFSTRMGTAPSREGVASAAAAPRSRAGEGSGARQH